ncbi:MAG: diphthine--ammonia ligase [Nanoarchaeota archaeon]|nr:diphthine--ammonia ligase [Nanoarchaeota archaeon]
MKCAVLFSGGKDSTYSAFLAKKAGYELACLITLHSENKESYMFHTPSIEQTEKQADVMNISLLVEETQGKKEEELKDLEKAIKRAKEEYEIDTIVTGALHSEYQASRIQKICDKLNLKCFNPLWHKDEILYLKELIKNNFEIIIVGVFAFPLTQSWLGKKIDKDFITRAEDLKRKYNIHPAGEGGEFETFVINCPLFMRRLKVKSFKDFNEGENSFRREIKVE